jgi:hypothetical protein
MTDLARAVLAASAEVLREYDDGNPDRYDLGLDYIWDKGVFLATSAPALARRVVRLEEALKKWLAAVDAVDAEAERAEKEGGFSSAPIVAMIYARKEARAALAGEEER